MLEETNLFIKEMEKCFTEYKNITSEEEVKVGVDLGTSNIVLTVLDSKNEPVAGILYPSTAVRDGIVVEYLNAVNIVRKLKSKLEKKLKRTLQYAATAIPPKIISGNIKVIRNVVEGAGFEVTNLVDEPTAASLVLNVENGAVVDIGGGTTGISIIENGKVVYSNDEPTGGHHLTLVLSGSLNISYDEAEKFKVSKENYDIVYPLVKPVIEKMSDIILHHIKGYNVNSIYLVGGTCCLEKMEDIVEKYTSVKAIKPYNPLLVTPIGIAMSMKSQ